MADPARAKRLSKRIATIVASAIESLQVSGRMVGIITHVRELTDRMPACIVIDKRPDGSRWDVRT